MLFTVRARSLNAFLPLTSGRSERRGGEGVDREGGVVGKREDERVDTRTGGREKGARVRSGGGGEGRGGHRSGR